MKLLCCMLLSLWMVMQIQGKPYRYRRSDEIKYAPCKNIYPQCPEWKNKYGWCENAQYKEYMATVCPAVCEFCRENKPQTRSEISHPESLQNLIVHDNDDDEEDTESGTNDDDAGEDKPKTLLKSMHEQGQLKAYAVSKPAAENKNDTKSNTKSDIGELPAESGAESGSGEQNEADEEISGDTLPTEDEANDQEPPEQRNASDASTSTSEKIPALLKEVETPSETSSLTSSSSDKPSKEKSTSTLKLPAPSSKVKDQNKVAADFLPEELLPATQKERKQNEKESFGSGQTPEGKLSFVLKQKFNSDYLDQSSTPYQLLSGNIKKDMETAMKGSKVKNIAFSEATIDGNPRQTGKTKVSFTLVGANQKVMKDLLKLVDAGDINGLALIKSSLENEDDD